MAESSSSNTKRRLVKNPETFRERAVKAGETSAAPTKRHRVRAAARRVTRPVTSPIGKAARKTSQSKPARMASKPLRFVGRILVPKYFRESWRELRLVQWPNNAQTRQLTFAVLIFAIVFGVFIAIIDYGLDKLFKQVLIK